MEDLEKGTHIAFQRLDQRLTISDKNDRVNNPSDGKTTYAVGRVHDPRRCWHDAVRETDNG